MKKRTKVAITIGALALVIGLGLINGGITPFGDPPFPTVMQMVLQVIGK